jgi:protein-tyrosine phosphatase
MLARPTRPLQLATVAEIVLAAFSRGPGRLLSFRNFHRTVVGGVRQVFRVRQRVNSWVERGAVAAGFLSGTPAAWAGCERLVFVCTGNICRSPYGEVVARSQGVNAISCGTHTDDGLPAYPRAIEVAAARNVDLSGHRTHRWEDIEIGAHDIVVALQLRHARSVLPRVRQVGGSVVLLSSMLPRFQTIHDPYGRPAQEFTRVFDLIDTAVSGIAGRLREAGAKA